ncbi:hypothetical protein GCM10020295_46550 [Streptomyces cinereospinus]
MLGTVGGAEQAGQGEQFAQHGGPARAEGVGGDEAVLLADGGRVGGVHRRRRAEDRQVGVAQHLAVAVVVGRGVARGEPDQAGDLAGPRGGQAGLAERAFGQPGGAFLVLGAVGEVDGVVEPGGEADQVGVVGVPLQRVDVVEDRGQVGQRVVVALRLLPAGDQVVGVRGRVGPPPGGAGGFQRADEAGAQGAGVGHAVHSGRTPPSVGA